MVTPATTVLPVKLFELGTHLVTNQHFTRESHAYKESNRSETSSFEGKKGAQGVNLAASKQFSWTRSCGRTDMDKIEHALTSATDHGRNVTILLQVLHNLVLVSRLHTREQSTDKQTEVNSNEFNQ